MTAKPLIRIVDDDEALTASSAMLLEAMGWDVAVWHSGGAFLDEADLMRPGCLVLDVRMPGLTGLDVQAELERRGSNLPILFLSAHGSIQMAVHVMRHGAVDFLEKPVEPMTLVQRVAQCVTASLSAAAIAGGHTMLASGSVSAVFGADVDKLIDAMLTAGAGENNPALVETLARQSGAAFEWLAEHGVNWMKTPYRAVGSPGAWSYSTGSAQAGYDYVQCLNRAYHRLGGRILYRTSASSLLFAAAESLDGHARSAVAGIFAERPEGPMLLIRTPAVIIAAGGFTANRAMIAAFRPDIDPQTPTTANPRGELLDGSTGDGILMAQAAGAKLVDMSAVEVVPFTGGRLTDFVGGDVWLNAEGRRFVSEGETFDVIRSAVEAQPEGRLWVVSDVKSNKGATLPVKLMSGTVASAESLEALAKALQVPFTTLRASIDRWNQSVKSGWDQDFNRPMPAQAQTIDTPPFYYGEERFSIHYTSGGIAISPKAQVLDRDDHPIPGLYAAGETTGGVHGRTRLGGCALTDCFVFGRIAGKEAALRSHKSLRPR